MNGQFPIGGRVGPDPQQPSLTIGADFLIDSNNLDVGLFVFQVGPARFQVGMPTASIVGFLRGLADNIEKKIQATPNIVRPPAGLFLPNGNGRA